MKQLEVRLCHPEVSEPSAAPLDTRGSPESLKREVWLWLLWIKTLFTALTKLLITWRLLVCFAFHHGRVNPW